jgi:hypothetical protein
MSISILLEPQKVSPVYNEVIVVLDSTEKTEDNFQFIIEVSVDGVYSSRLKVSPNPEGYGVVDLHKHLEAAISYDLDLVSNNTFNRINNSFKPYSIALFEEYVVNHTTVVITDNGGNTQLTDAIPHGLNVGDQITVSNSTVPAYDGIHEVIQVVNSQAVVTDFVYTANAIADWIRTDGGTTIVDSLTIFSEDKYTFNGVLPWVDVPNFDYTEYLPSITTPCKWVSSIPSINTVRYEDKNFINFYNGVDNLAYYLEVTSDNGTFRVSNLDFTSVDISKFLTVNVGAEDLNNTSSPVTVVSGSLPITDTNTTSYTVKLIDDLFNPTSETITFNIDDSCNNYEIFRIVYLDKLGSFLNVNFDLQNSEAMKIKRTNYLKNYGSYNSVLNTYGWNSQDRGTTRLDSEIMEEYTIRTNWLRDKVAAQVKDAIESPEVYHLDESGVLRAIEIKTNNLQIKNTRKDKVFNYTITFEYATKNTVQRG